MQWKSLLLGAAVASAAILVAQRAFSDDDKDKKGGPTPEMMALMQPGPEHEGLKAYVGSWVGTGTMQDEGMPQPMPMTVKQSNQAIFGGRFIQIDEEMPMEGGAAMHDRILLGFDRVQKKYVQAFVGDFGTQIGVAEGERDAAKKTVSMRGVEHRAPGVDVKYRITATDVVNDAYALEVWFDTGGGEKRIMEVTFKRAK